MSCKRNIMLQNLQGQDRSMCYVAFLIRDKRTLGAGNYISFRITIFKADAEPGTYLAYHDQCILNLDGTL